MRVSTINGQGWIYLGSARTRLFCPFELHLDMQNVVESRDDLISQDSSSADDQKVPGQMRTEGFSIALRQDWPW